MDIRHDHRAIRRLDEESRALGVIALDQHDGAGLVLGKLHRRDITVRRGRRGIGLVCHGCSGGGSSGGGLINHLAGGTYQVFIGGKGEIQHLAV